MWNIYEQVSERASEKTGAQRRKGAQARKRASEWALEQVSITKVEGARNEYERARSDQKWNLNQLSPQTKPYQNYEKLLPDSLWL